MSTAPTRRVAEAAHKGQSTRLQWRPLTGLVHPYREQAVAEIEAALPELARGRPGVPVRLKYTLHGYQAQIGYVVTREETATGGTVR